MLKQIEEIKELGIRSIVVSTKDDVLLLIREAKYKLQFSEDNGGLFGRKISVWDDILDTRTHVRFIVCKLILVIS